MDEKRKEKKKHNNAFEKDTKIRTPGPNSISNGRNQKVMLSVEQIMLHLPTAKFLHLPLKHLAKASEKASEHQRQDSGINGYWGSPSLAIARLQRFQGQDCNLHICVYEVLADTSEVKPFEVALPVLVMGCGSHYTVPVFS